MSVCFPARRSFANVSLSTLATFMAVSICPSLAEASTPPILVTLSPASASTAPGGTVALTATVANTIYHAVYWYVDGIASGNAAVGTIAFTGDSAIYTAPAMAGSHTVKATSHEDTSKSATASVTVAVPASVTSVAASPSALAINVGAQNSFTAAVAGTGNFSAAVTWSAQRGSITSTGLYTAPTTGGSDVVTATSVQTPGKTANASVTVVVPAAVTSVVASPGTLTINAGAQNPFTATVAGTGNYSAAVTWSAQRGSITSTGLYTAPATGGSDVVTATSVQTPGKTANASVTVVVPAAVTSVEARPATLTINAGAQNPFTATVAGTGSYSAAVTWSAQRGSITSTGLYTAPATGGSDVVTATSVQTPGKTASASVTVAVPATVTSVAASPSTLMINTGAQNSFTATVAGTGSYSAAVTWSAQRGSITSAGLYTAPTTGGSDVVTATSAQTPGKTANASVTVVVPPVVNAVAAIPATLSVISSAQAQFAATVTGTGSFSSAVTWSAQRGSITSAGLYTAPSTAGSDVVTASSVQTPGKTAIVAVTVNPKASLVAPVLAGPVELQELSGPYSASATLGTGLTGQWSLTGGSLLSAATGTTVQFQAGSAPFATLACTASNGTGTLASQRQMVALPFAPRNYLADLKALVTADQSAVEAEIASGNCATYYYTSYYLMGLAAGAQATEDPTVMAALVGYINQIMAQAQPLVRNGITYQEWGPWDANGHPQQLNTFQAMGPLARTAMVIAQNPAFLAQYGTELNQIVAFVDQSIFKYWFDKPAGYYANTGSSASPAFVGGTIPWLSIALGGWGDGGVDVDTCDHFGMIATWMYQATGNPRYLDYATRVAKGFRDHITVNNGCLQWDMGVWPITAGQNLEGSPDTSHSNREAMMVVSMYEAGIEYQLSDVQQLAATFTNVIWNQSYASPMFSNYIDGSNLDYRTAPAWANGIVFHGWDMVGRYSPEAQRVLAIGYQALRSGTAQNASLSANDSGYGLFELSGALAHNITQ